MRLPGDELDGAAGLTADDFGQITAILEDRELVDFLDVSIGGFGEMVHAMYASHMMEVPASSTVKSAVQVTPVFAVQRILTPAEAESVSESGAADAVVVVRALIADPDWPRKAQRGRASPRISSVRWRIRGTPPTSPNLRRSPCAPRTFLRPTTSPSPTLCSTICELGVPCARMVGFGRLAAVLSVYDDLPGPPGEPTCRCLHPMGAGIMTPTEG